MPGRGQTILNTERVQPEDVSGGFLRLQASLDLQRGNSHVFDLKADEAVGYRGAHDWVLLVGGLAYLSSGGSVSVDDRHGQVRYGHFLSDRTRTFHFVQAQASRAQLLKRRILVGSGIRHAFVASAVTRLQLGLGLMWEDERLDADRLPLGYAAHVRDVRGDLVGYALRRISDGSTLSEVLYVEPRVDAPADVRVLNEARLATTVVKGVELSLGLRWRYDGRPPPGVRRHDVELATALAAMVR